LSLYSMYVTMSISIGLYPNLDLWNANKLHYITLHVDLHIQVGEASCSYYWQQEVLDIFMHIRMKLMIVGGMIWEMQAHPK